MYTPEISVSSVLNTHSLFASVCYVCVGGGEGGYNLIVLFVRYRFRKTSQDTYHLNESYRPTLPMFYLSAQVHNVFMLFIGPGN